MTAPRPPEKDQARHGETPAGLQCDSLSGGIERKSSTEAEQPEHRGDRRRFLIWALMVGAVKPEAVTQRIVAEIEGSTP